MSRFAFPNLERASRDGERFGVDGGNVCFQDEWTDTLIPGDQPAYSVRRSTLMVSTSRTAPTHRQERVASRREVVVPPQRAVATNAEGAHRVRRPNEGAVARSRTRKKHGRECPCHQNGNSRFRL